MTFLEQQFKEGKLAGDLMGLSALVIQLQGERDSWVYNANQLQKGYNELEKQKKDVLIIAEELQEEVNELTAKISQIAH